MKEYFHKPCSFIRSLLDNRRVLVGRLERVKEEYSKYDHHLGNLKAASQNLERKSNNLKMDVLKLAKQIDQYKNVLLSRGLSADINQSEASQVHQPVSILVIY